MPAQYTPATHPHVTYPHVVTLLLQDTVRLCAVQWANRLYPLKHHAARYICILAAGDTKLEVGDPRMALCWKRGAAQVLP